MNKLLTFDIGGTYIKWSIINLDKKDIILQDQFKTVHTSIEEFLEPIFKICDAYINDILSISISCPGSVDKKNGIINGVSAINIIHGPNFKEIFFNKYNITISIENDANCSLLGECYNGSVQNTNDACLLIIGTGVGGAALIGNEIYNGHKNYGVEFGLLLQTYNNRLTRLSTSCGMYNIIKDFQKHLNTSVSGYDIMNLYSNNDIYTVKYMNKVFYQLALACYNIQQLYNPEIILIGGGISQNPILITKVNYYFNEIHCLENKEGTNAKIINCKNHNNANLYGAAYNYILEKKEH